MSEATEKAQDAQEVENQTEGQNRYKLLVVSPELIFSLFQEGLHQNVYEVIQHAVPENARFVNVRHGWENHIEILIESPDFEPLKGGDSIPVLMPVMRVPTEMTPEHKNQLAEKKPQIVLTDADKERFQENMRQSTCIQ